MIFDAPPPSVGGLDLNSSNRGCARLGGEVDPPLGVVTEEVAVLIVLVHLHRRAVLLRFVVFDHPYHVLVNERPARQGS